MIETFTGGIAISWLHNHGISSIEFPSYCLDVNAMENLWYELQKRVEKHNATTTDKLQKMQLHTNGIKQQLIFFL
jgi:hypothetical protein